MAQPKTRRLVTEAALDVALGALPEPQKGDDGADAFEVAQAAGYTGTRSQWLASLKGDPSTVPGPSAYQVAVSRGFTGTEAQWLETLKGPQGDPGPGVEGAVLSDEVDEVAVVTPQAHADLGAGADAATAYLLTADQWAPQTVYAAGAVVEHEGAAQRCITPHTSQTAGLAYDRAKWAPLDVAELTLASTVPVRRQAGVSASAPPRLGVFQGRPRSFVEKGKRVLWAPTTTDGVNVSSGTVAAGTAPGGSLVFTGNSSSATMGVVLPAAMDLRGKHLLLLLKMATVASRAVNVQLTSAAGGTSYTNYLDMAMVSGNVDGPGVDRWHKTSMSPATGAVVGTGADLSAITGVRIASRLGTNVVELGGLWARDDAADLAKVVLWLDDGGYGNQAHQTAIRAAARYGFPMTTAYIASNMFIGTGPQASDLRWHQDHHGLQPALHANGPQDHNAAQTGQVIFEQALEWQSQAAAVGLRHHHDGAYWNPGFPGANTDEDAVTVRKLFRSMRGGRARLAETLPPADPWSTRALLVSTQDLSGLTPLVEQAITYKGLAQFVWHDMNSTALSIFDQLCAWLDAPAQRARVQVTTAAGAFDPLCG